MRITYASTRVAKGALERLAERIAVMIAVAAAPVIITGVIKFIVR